MVIRGAFPCAAPSKGNVNLMEHVKPYAWGLLAPSVAVSESKLQIARLGVLRPFVQLYCGA